MLILDWDGTEATVLHMLIITCYKQSKFVLEFFQELLKRNIMKRRDYDNLLLIILESNY